MDLEFLDVLSGWAVALGVWIQAGATGLIKHPDAGFPVAEGDFSADDRARESEAVHGGGDESGGDRCGLFHLLLHDFRLLDQLDPEVENEKTGVHVGQSVAEIVL